MKTVINPRYADACDDLKKIVKGEYTPLRIFCDSRNRVDLVDIKGHGPVVVKKFKRTNIFTALLYTFFRKTKARRSYENALRLTEAGIDTPYPVAYFEKSSRGLFRDGYYISEYCSWPEVKESFYPDGELPDDHKQLAHELALFTLDLHNKGILPLDFNTSNILFKKDGDKYSFSLIDINRMKFTKGKLSLKQRMLSLYQLGTYPRDYHDLLGTYSYYSGIDFEEGLFEILLHRRDAKHLRRFKDLFRRR